MWKWSNITLFLLFCRRLEILRKMDSAGTLWVDEEEVYRKVSGYLSATPVVRKWQNLLATRGTNLLRE
ncbi:hypothetical protein HMPREF3182_00897 [Megasphaera hutchinsoni]|uniref:Uncharacterized protein n=1 Tax=Megasphaera hutchinsoni TaxID=1588748 RepID=A0A134CFG7_9FIRM|nr:hypothetical protein HMPREF3182_00897 [Megasphaera hutchinsoni]